MLLICVTSTLASAQEPAHKARPHPVKRAPIAKPAKPAEKPHEKKADVDPADQHRRHFRTIIVYTRPAVILVGPVWARVPRLQAEAQILRDAYLALSRADHDYDGHRLEAMRETAIAGGLLGITLRGDGKGDESQDASDAQLDIAQVLLERANRGLVAKGYPDVANHVQEAIQQIEVALNED